MVTVQKFPFPWRAWESEECFSIRILGFVLSRCPFPSFPGDFMSSEGGNSHLGTFGPPWSACPLPAPAPVPGGRKTASYTDNPFQCTVMLTHPPSQGRQEPLSLHWVRERELRGMRDSPQLCTFSEFVREPVSRASSLRPTPLLAVCCCVRWETDGLRDRQAGFESQLHGFPLLPFPGTGTLTLRFQFLCFL